MTDTPTLVFLHGVRTGEFEELWGDVLSRSLTDIGYPDLSGVSVIAPRYRHALSEPEDGHEFPGSPRRKANKEERQQHHRDVDRRTATLETLLGRHNRGNGARWAGAVVDAAVAIPVFEEAQNYLRVTCVRARVLQLIVDQLPQSGRIVIVAHSLGSVIAADLLNHLPVELDVGGLVTIGSPLAEGNFDVDVLRKKLKTPPLNLEWWVNCWSMSDPVAALRGVSSVFPWVLDIKVPTPKSPLSAHNADAYLADPAVSEAIGFGLFGSRSRELAIVDRSVDVALDRVELADLQTLRYAHLIRRELSGDLQIRFTGALRQVQAQVVEDLRVRAQVEGRPIGTEIRRLLVDYTDAEQDIPEPHPNNSLDMGDSLVRLVELAVQNTVSPYDIEVEESVRRQAMRELTAEMWFGTKLGDDVFDALDEAQRILPGPKKNLLKWGALGAGIVLIISTGGLALAPMAGVYGAAAVTTALASFGPGGMIGGLLTAGTLVSAGTGSVVAGVMSPATTSESVETLVMLQLTVVLLRERRGLDPDHSIWFQLAEYERNLNMMRNRLAEFSDKKSPLLEEISRKLAAVTGALDYMRKNGLGPATLEAPQEPDGNLVRRISTPRMLKG